MAHVKLTAQVSRGGTPLVALPPGSFDLPIFDVVLNAKTVRGAIDGRIMLEL